MEGRRAQPSHDGHMPHGERDTGSATISIPPHILLLLLWAEEKVLVEGRVPCSSPHPGTPQSPGTPVSLHPCILAPPRPYVPAVPCPTPCPGTTVFLHLVSLSPGCSSGTGCSGFRWWLVKDSTLLAWSLIPRWEQVATRKCHLEAWAKQGRVWGHSAAAPSVSFPAPRPPGCRAGGPGGGSGWPVEPRGHLVARATGSCRAADPADPADPD